MKHLLLAPFLLGFISPVSAEQPLFIQEILQRPIEDEKGWLKTKGSTSEWLEVKNWDNDEWWIRNYFNFRSYK